MLENQRKTEREIIYGPCPMPGCAGQIFRTTTSYLCNNRRSESGGCTFKLNRNNLQRSDLKDIPDEVIPALLVKNNAVEIKGFKRLDGSTYSRWGLLIWAPGDRKGGPRRWHICLHN